MTIPREIEEAAVMDGANPLQLFAQVMLPLVKPALLAIAVLSFTGNWNNFQGPVYLYQHTTTVSSDSGFVFFFRIALERSPKVALHDGDGDHDVIAHH